MAFISSVFGVYLTVITEPEDHTAVTRVSLLSQLYVQAVISVVCILVPKTNVISNEPYLSLLIIVQLVNFAYLVTRQTKPLIMKVFGHEGLGQKLIELFNNTYQRASIASAIIFWFSGMSFPALFASRAGPAFSIMMFLSLMYFTFVTSFPYRGQASRASNARDSYLKMIEDESQNDPLLAESRSNP